MRNLHALVVLTSILPAIGRAAATDRAWSLATDDTELHLTVDDHAIRVEAIRDRQGGWNWLPHACEVPLPALAGAKSPTRWKFVDADENWANAHQITLHFKCDDPAMELTSVWR